MPITIADILRVATELDNEGEKLTNSAVRKRIGGGSYTTINAGMKEWRDEQERRRKESFQDLKLTLEQIIDLPAIIKAARDFAQQEVKAESLASQNRVAMAERELHAATTRIDELEFELKEFQRKSKEAQERTELLVKQLTTLEERIENMAVHERALVQRVEKEIEAKANAERKLVACEENTKLLQDQLSRQKEKIETLEAADETASGTDEIYNRLLKRMNQTSRLIDRLKYDTNRNNERKTALERAVADAHAIIDRCYNGGIVRPK